MKILSQVMCVVLLFVAASCSPPDVAHITANCQELSAAQTLWVSLKMAKQELGADFQKQNNNAMKAQNRTIEVSPAQFAAWKRGQVLSTRSDDVGNVSNLLQGKAGGAVRYTVEVGSKSESTSDYEAANSNGGTQSISSGEFKEALKQLRAAGPVQQMLEQGPSGASNRVVYLMRGPFTSDEIVRVEPYFHYQVSARIENVSGSSGDLVKDLTKQARNNSTQHQISLTVPEHVATSGQLWNAKSNTGVGFQTTGSALVSTIESSGRVEDTSRRVITVNIRGVERKFIVLASQVPSK